MGFLSLTIIINYVDQIMHCYFNIIQSLTVSGLPSRMSMMFSISSSY